VFKPLNNNKKCTETGNYLKYLDNPHARYVVDLTAQLWLHIPISFAMVRVGDLKLTTTDALPSVSNVMRKSTRARSSLRLNVLRHGKMHTAKLLAGYLKQAT
jgi:hypothetical protein